MNNPGKTKQDWDKQDENDQQKNTAQGYATWTSYKLGMNPCADEG